LNSSLAEMLDEAIECRLTGIYHLSGATRVSRYEFAQKLCHALNLDSSSLRPARMGEMSWTAKRPMDSSLDISKAMGTLNIKPLDVEEALQRLRMELGD
jgi:dTDP-4-dehydrorhamnose reductase